MIPTPLNLIIPLISFFLITLDAHGVKTSLNDAYKAALVRSETIDIQRELLIQAEETNTQAMGAMLPTFTGAVTLVRQASPISPTGASLYPASQNTGKITGSLPLFRGLRDFAALRQRKVLEVSQRYSLLTAARQLFYDLSTTFYNVLAYQKDEQNYETQIKTNEQRLLELQQFYKIGRSQLTDVLTLKASIVSLRAQLEATRGLLAAEKENFSYFTGWQRDTQLADDEILFPYSTGPGDIHIYLDNMNYRSDVKVAMSNVSANDEGIAIARGGHLPNIDLIGNYYFFRPGALSDVNWDAQLAVSVPLFQGGIIQSQVRQASSVARQFNLQLSQTRRLAEKEIRTFYDQVEADRKQVLRYSELVDVSKKTYETETQYFRNGLVTNLDVLLATTTYQDALRQRDRAKFQYQSDAVKLQAASGRRPEINIDVDSTQH
jgi:outer membrane protein